MRRIDFLRILGLTAVSGAIIAKDTFNTVSETTDYPENTIGYFVNQLPEEYIQHLQRYKQYFNNHCTSGYYAMGALTEVTRPNFYASTPWAEVKEDVILRHTAFYFLSNKKRELLTIEELTKYED